MTEETDGRDRALSAKRYVEHVRSLALEEAAASALLDDAREMALRAQRLGCGSGGGPLHGDDPMFAAVERAMAAAGRLEGAQARLVEEREEFAGLVMALDDPAHRLLLTRRVQGMTWAAIAEEMGYSQGHARRLADAAYAALAPLVPTWWIVQEALDFRKMSANERK